MVVLVFGEDLFSMDGDGLLGTPVDTGQAMAAMGPDDGSFGRTDDIAHGQMRAQRPQAMQRSPSTEGVSSVPRHGGPGPGS